MAFPYETAHLLAQLRASYIALSDTDDFARRIIRPIAYKSPDDPEFPLAKTVVPDSPPVTFHIARHVQKSIHNSTHTTHNHSKHVRHNRRKSRRNNELQQIRQLQLDNINDVQTDDKTSPIDFEVAAEPDPTPVSKDSNVDNYEIEDAGVEEKPAIATEMKKESSGTASSSHVNNFGLLYSKTIRGKKGSSSGILKFFHIDGGNNSNSSLQVGGSDSDSEDDSSINTQPHTQSLEIDKNKLENIREELSNPHDEFSEGGEVTETESIGEKRKNKRKHRGDNSDVVTIDSDFGVPVDATGHVVRNYNEDDISDEDLGDEDYSYDDDEDEDEDDDDDDDEDHEVFSEDEGEDDDDDSTDSAFTDIETDSILDSSILLDSFDDDTSNMYSFPNQNSNEFTSKKNRKKKRAHSFDTQSLSRTSNFKNASTPSGSKLLAGGKSSSSMNAKKPSLSFEKVDPTAANGTKKSNLSSMILFRHRSTDVNPLNYYAFADYRVVEDAAKKATLSVFLPPNNKPVIKDLSINNNVSIADCIGYILLNLCKLPEFKDDLNDPMLLNPNYWRLELVDEDGENYGSFGILDRSRLLSSYNNPKELALCKVTSEQEIQKNEKQTPLAMEFRKGLDEYKKRRVSIDDIIEDDSVQTPVKIAPAEEENKVELKIVFHSLSMTQVSDYSIFYASRGATVGLVLRKFCSQHGLMSSKYKFRLLHDSSKTNGNNPNFSSFQTNLNSSSLHPNNRVLKEVERVSDLESNVIELVPSENKLNIIQESTENLMMSTITPSESTFTMHITPDKKQLEEKMQAITLNTNNSTTVSKPTSEVSNKVPDSLATKKNKVSSNKYLDDIMTGKNPQLPTNLNTVYFKWKVWRKKTTILNKIEKSLIIDGDYIHLTPSDDIVFKGNPNDIPLSAQSAGQSHHHHHHLYYYNYNNYYKELMMKTSSFHITQVIKMKQYKNSKNPNHFKIVIQKQLDASTTNTKDATIKKKYDLEAESVEQCQEIIDKLRWVLQVYNMSSINAL